MCVVVGVLFVGFCSALLSETDVSNMCAGACDVLVCILLLFFPITRRFLKILFVNQARVVFSDASVPCFFFCASLFLHQTCNAALNLFDRGVEISPPLLWGVVVRLRRSNNACLAHRQRSTSTITTTDLSGCIRFRCYSITRWICVSSSQIFFHSGRIRTCPPSFASLASCAAHPPLVHSTRGAFRQNCSPWFPHSFLSAALFPVSPTHDDQHTMTFLSFNKPMPRSSIIRAPALGSLNAQVSEGLGHDKRAKVNFDVLVQRIGKSFSVQRRAHWI